MHTFKYTKIKHIHRTEKYDGKKKKKKVYQKTREGEQCGHGHGNQTWLEQDLGRVSGLASGKMPKDGFFYARLTSGGGGCLANVSPKPKSGGGGSQVK